MRGQVQIERRDGPFYLLSWVGGARLRFRMYPDLLARLDLGVSSEKIAAYFDFGHPF